MGGKILNDSLLSTAMPAELKAALAVFADDKGLTPSSAARMILHERLKRDGYLRADARKRT